MVGKNPELFLESLTPTPYAGTPAQPGEGGPLQQRVLGWRHSSPPGSERTHGPIWC